MDKATKTTTGFINMHKRKANRSIVFVLLLAVFPFLNQCKKESSSIPNTYVDFYVYLTQTPSLNSVGNWVYLTGGVRGIILFRKSQSEFAAYERCCPYDPNAANARIEVDASNIIGVDHNCGSKFGLSDNSILNGPSSRPMKTYYADYDASTQSVHVHS